MTPSPSQAGSLPAPAFLPLSVPNVCGKEWQYLKECLDTNFVSSVGPFVSRFEQELARYTGAKFAVACVSGTAALHVALLLAGVQPGDEVIVPTLTFISSVNVIRYAQAVPVFMDCDAFYNADAEKVRQFLLDETVFKAGRTYNKKTGRRIAAFLPVHVLGNAAWLDQLLPLCRERGITVIEDAAESLGTVYTTGEWKGCHTGTLAELGCVSFNGNKIITTGGGGMILTNNPALAEKAKYLTTQAKDDDARFIHHEVGYNYRLTNVQAALGIAQLELLPGFLENKQRNFEAYGKQLNQVAGLRLADSPGYARNNHWMYPLQIEAGVFGRDWERVMADLARQGIQSRPLWYLNHRQRPYQDCQRYLIERADEMWANTLCLPCSTNLGGADVERVVAALLNPR
jgi:aminotransferase in exopolysaccharide biosynthesis